MVAVLLAAGLRAASSAGVLPAARDFSSAWRQAGVQGEIPAPDTIVNVRDFGALGDGSHNDAPAVQAAINAFGGAPGVVYFPPGTYSMLANISVRNGIVLRGHRPATTTLRFNTAGHAINLVGGRSGSYQSIISGYDLHSSVIEVANGTNFQSGDFAETQQDLDPAWTGITWDNCGQMVRITAVSGNVLSLEQPLRLQYAAALNPRIIKVVPRMHAGVENLRVERLKVGADAERYNRYTLRLFLAANCWVRGVESYNTFGGHIAFVNSTQSEVTGCYLHHAHFYGGGGSGYGTRMEYKTGECKLENNILHTLRHAMLVQGFVNGNVHGYNYSFDVSSTSHGADGGDISIHGNYPYANLFEGNIVQNIWLDNAHGANGPHNLYFRNRAERAGFNMTNTQSHRQSIVGNELFPSPNWIYRTFTGDGYKLLGTDPFAYGNHHSTKGIQPPGTGDLADYSYYLGPDPAQPPPQPVWWTIPESIPTIGPPHALGPAKSNPARARWLAGGVLTVGPPSIELQPVGATRTAGETATLSVTAHGEAPLQYTWLHDGQPVAGADGPELTLVPVRPHHAGTYRVRVRDAQGHMLSAPAELTVLPGRSDRTVLSVAKDGTLTADTGTAREQMTPETIASPRTENGSPGGSPSNDAANGASCAGGRTSL